MDWRDEGLLLGIRDHGESSAIIDVLTVHHGRHSGLVRGGAGQKMSAVLQPGTQLALEWRARLEEHLGHFRVEPLQSRAAGIMAGRGTLAAFNAMAALIQALVPERAPDQGLHDASVALADALAAQAPDWPAIYARWEVQFLETLGFGLDLERCAVSGAPDGLAFVSPRTGRAVTREAGSPWAGKLLPLPGFLIGRGEPSAAAVVEALQLTGWFLANRAVAAMERDALPEARERLLRLLDRAAAAPGGG
ncbi:DNA repair protein RecO [Limibaculum sp. M0105]|uniref:DNA repair protein RecO n=1 Tax=Thermohalobaculum xanthum TaxID=2753746 RepID=A0A8J7SDG7_9RHOB|nr:DNA repair protein RecO [Thermohalobaculum xanthum]MBK0400052.1 DNA repair protein RecO [Thermohalobaculum xanthum]